MDWRHIPQLLDRFRHITPPNEHVREVVINAVYSKTGVKIQKDDVNIRNFSIYLENISRITRSEVKIKKIEILKFIKNALGDNSPNDIR